MNEKRNLFSSKGKIHEMLNENSRRFTFNLSSKKFNLCSKERRKFLSKKGKIHEVWTMIHEDFWSILPREINFNYKWKKEFFELKWKNSRNLNENSRRFTFNLASEKYICVQKKEENFWGKKTKITKYERLFTKNHAHARPIEVYTVVESFKTTF